MAPGAWCRTTRTSTTSPSKLTTACPADGQELIKVRLKGVDVLGCPWVDGGEVQRLLDSYGQGRASRFLQRVNDDFQHPLKKPAAQSSSPSNPGRSIVDVSLDTGAEAVLQIVLESLSSMDW